MSTPSKKINLTTLLALSEKWANSSKFHQDIAAKNEDWGLKLKLIQSEAQHIKTALQSTVRDSSSLNKSFQLLEKKLKLMTKSLQKKQDLFSKKRAEVHEKLLGVVDKFSNGSKTLFLAVKENCQKIEGDLKTSKSYLDGTARKIEECDQLLKSIRDNMDKDLLPESIEACAETSKDLKQRLEQLNKASFAFQDSLTRSGQVLVFPQMQTSTAQNGSQSGTANATTVQSVTATNSINSGNAATNSNAAVVTVSQLISNLSSSAASTASSNAASNASSNASSTSTAQTLQQWNQASIKTSLTLLRDNCQANVKLLDLVTANLKRVFKSIDEKDDATDSKTSESKQEKKQEFKAQ